MQFDPASPLYAVSSTTPRQDAFWIKSATAACSDAVNRIDSLLDSTGDVDRDSKVCLDAVRNSLLWVLDQPVSAHEMQVTISRALAIFQRIELADDEAAAWS